MRAYSSSANGATGHFEIDGIRVTGEQYRQYFRLMQTLGIYSRLPGERRQALELELRSLLGDADRWPALIHLISDQEQVLPAALVADVLASDWLGGRVMWDELQMLGEYHQLPADVQPLFLDGLKNQLGRASSDLRIAVQGFFERVEELGRLEHAVDASGPAKVAAAAYVALFVERTWQGQYIGHASSFPVTPLPAPEVRTAVFRRLLTLRCQDHLPGPAASEFSRSTFLRSWTSHMQAALTPLLETPLSDQDVSAGLEVLVASHWAPLRWDNGGYVSVLKRLVKRAAEQSRLSAAGLAAARRSVLTGYQVENLDWVEAVARPELNVGEHWAEAALLYFGALPAEERQVWTDLLSHARSTTGGKPSAKWLKEAQARLQPLQGEFAELLASWLGLVGRPRSFPLQMEEYAPDPNPLFDPYNAEVLKGLLWMVPLAPSDGLARAVARVVGAALRKAPGVGPKSPKIANAGVYALSQLPGEAALASLDRLSTSVTYKGTLKEIDKALGVLAARMNVTPEELLELSVPTLRLQEVGHRTETLGDVEARLTVDVLGAQLNWSKGGKPLKSVPASVKRDFKEELAELKTAQKDAEQLVAAIRDRLDASMIETRVWSAPDWRERYLDHPLVGTVARRLIWQIAGRAACFTNGALRDLGGLEVPLPDGAEVQLWHPLQGTVEEVLAWRDRLEAQNVAQPFKQAWREVYVLTDAERRTATYSNRFAAHILKQHEFHALAAARGWDNRLRLMVDDSYPPATRSLPAAGLRAEFWIEGVGETYEVDTNASGSYLRLKTDQVRFYPHGAPSNHAHAGGGSYTQYVSQEQTPTAAVPLAEVPVRVLSEVLRDVDLFVGVASVGNDPTWQDGGPEGRYRDYWQSYSFGELSATAETRRAMLTRLLPKLKIAERLSLDGRFLRVRGDIRSYKIHLGSGNILMEPNDQYLCIVPSTGAASGTGVQVPFDGDRVLSVILSKALMLATDTKITDPTIVSQIGRKRG